MGSECVYWSTQTTRLNCQCAIFFNKKKKTRKRKKIYRRSVLIKVCSRLSWISTMLATDLLLLLICSCSSIIGTCQEIGKMLRWNCYLKKFHEERKKNTLRLFCFCFFLCLTFNKNVVENKMLLTNLLLSRTHPKLERWRLLNRHVNNCNRILHWA